MRLEHLIEKFRLDSTRKHRDAVLLRPFGHHDLFVASVRTAPHPFGWADERLLRIFRCEPDDINQPTARARKQYGQDGQATVETGEQGDTNLGEFPSIPFCCTDFIYDKLLGTAPRLT